MKISRLIYAGMLLLAAGKVSAQEGDWNYINPEHTVSKDSFTRKGYTLLFISQAPAFDSKVKGRLIEAFFTVYPQEAKAYNKHTSKKVIFIIDPKYTGVAAASGNIVRFNPEWFIGHAGDIDVVTHEVMHIVQSYPGGEGSGPGWLTEGIADYVRHKYGVDNEGAGWSLTAFNAKQSYTDAYRITARFLVWVEKNHDKKLVKEMDNAMRTNTYNDSLWKAYTGKTVDELWAAYSANPAI